MAQRRAHAIPRVRILDHLAAVERGTQRRGMRILAAQPAPHAAIDDGRDRIDLQRVAALLQRQRRATRQANARMIAGARVLVDAVLDAHETLALLEQVRPPWFNAPLPLELALALGDDDLESGKIGGEGFIEGLAQVGDAIAV